MTKEAPLEEEGAPLHPSESSQLWRQPFTYLTKEEGGKTGIGVSYFLKRHRRALTWGGGGAGVSKSLDLIREA